MNQTSGPVIAGAKFGTRPRRRRRCGVLVWTWGWGSSEDL